MPSPAKSLTDAAASLAEHQPLAGAQAMPAWRFRLAVLRHDRAVYRAARALLRDDREAEDVVQETFLRYWQQGHAVLQPRAWLLRVARNACLDRLRRSGRLVSEEDTQVAEQRDERDPPWHYQQDELRERLSALVARLPEPQRSLIELFDGQGVSGAECAEILGLSLTQVKVYLHRARRRLRAQLEGRI